MGFIVGGDSPGLCAENPFPGAVALQPVDSNLANTEVCGRSFFPSRQLSFLLFSPLWFGLFQRANPEGLVVSLPHLCSVCSVVQRSQYYF